MTHRVTPFSSLNTCLTVQPAQVEALANQDILFNIFCTGVNVPNLLNFSLVNRLWCQVSTHPHLWSAICRQTGIPVPLDTTQSRNAYFCQAGSLVLEKVRRCSVPLIEEIDIKIDFSNCFVHFVDNAYMIVQDKSTISVCSLETGEVINTIAPGQQIFSVCKIQKEIYLSLADRTIQAYSLTMGAQEPLLTIQAHADEDIKSDPYPNEMIYLIANDRWLISRSSKMVKQWDLATGQCVSSISIVDLGVNQLQIDQNKLYATIYSPNGSHSLSSVDLNQCELIFAESIPVSTYYVNICGSSCSYLVDVEQSSDLSDSEESGFNAQSTEIQTLNLRSQQTYSRIQVQTGFSQVTYLKTFSGLAILARDGFDPDKIYNDSMEITDPDVVEIIDLKAGVVLHRIQKHQIHQFGQRWSIDISHATICYATEQGKVVKITFPQEEHIAKKRTNNDVQTIDNKRCKIEGKECSDIGL
ncbi:MAG: hypothetical protein KF898_03745 [Parachlamydiales bacterium]|nr:hypothetical protein [Candidatus Acheromyda pituitae]